MKRSFIAHTGTAHANLHRRPLTLAAMGLSIGLAAGCGAAGDGRVGMEPMGAGGTTGQRDAAPTAKLPPATGGADGFVGADGAGDSLADGGATARDAGPLGHDVEAVRRDGASEPAMDSGAVEPPPAGSGPASVANREAGDPSKDRTYSVSGVAQKGPVKFTMWVPGGVKPLRCNWFTGESRREIARLLNCNQISMDNHTTKAPETMRMLGELAQSSGHPEVAHLPIVASGYSAATFFPGALVSETPDRLIGIFTGGIGGMGPDAPTEKLVPWMHFEGEKDGKRDMGATHLATALEDRSGGSLFAKAIRWGQGHAWGDVNNLFFPWAYQIIALRSSATGPAADAPVRPAAIQERDGWLVDMEAWGMPAPLIAPYASYTGDKAKAGWVPDGYIAHVWRAYSAYKGSTPIKILSPEPLCEGCKPFMVQGPTSLNVKVSTSRPTTKVELWNGDAKLAERAAAPYEFNDVKLAPGVNALIAVGVFDGQTHYSKPSPVIVTKVKAPPLP